MREEQEAVAAVEQQLASFGLAPGEHRDRLVNHALARASGRYAANVGLARAAVKCIRADLEAWSAFVLGEGSETGEPLSRIRAAYLRCGGPSRWPEALCCYDLNDACVRELRQAAPPKLPPEAPRAMPQQALERWSVADLAPASVRTRPVGSQARASSISAG